MQFIKFFQSTVQFFTNVNEIDDILTAVCYITVSALHVQWQDFLTSEISTFVCVCTFLVPVHPGGPGQRAVKGVFVCVTDCHCGYWQTCLCLCRRRIHRLRRFGSQSPKTLPFLWLSKSWVTRPRETTMYAAGISLWYSPWSAAASAGVTNCFQSNDSLLHLIWIYASTISYNHFEVQYTRFQIKNNPFDLWS